MNKKLTPEAVRDAILANGGWRGSLARKAGLYASLVRYWLDRGMIPERRIRDLMRFKVFRDVCE